MKWFLFITMLVVGGCQKLPTNFHQPRDALLLYSPSYEKVFETFEYCVDIGCSDAQHKALEKRRDEILAAEWPAFHAALTDDDNWRYDDRVKESFFALIDEAGGLEAARDNCVPAVRWYKGGGKAYHFFDGLTCNGKLIKIST